MNNEGVMVAGVAMLPTRTIVENAVLASSVSTLVAAVQAAGLVDTLNGAGPFTVFAPTNAAFAKLPAGTVENLIKPENKATLVGILTYHVIPGAWKAADLKEGDSMVTTVNGKELKISKKDGMVWLNGSAKVEIADVISSNGVTHVIDSVMLP